MNDGRKQENSSIMIIDDKKAMLIIHVRISNFWHKNRSSQARGSQFDELCERNVYTPIYLTYPMATCFSKQY